jgi:hypothetical protein
MTEGRVPVGPKCPYCNLEYASATYLNMHIKRAHTFDLFPERGAGMGFVASVDECLKQVEKRLPEDPEEVG